MNRVSFAMLAVVGVLWPALAMAACDVPGSNATEAELGALVACMKAAGETEDDARNGMVKRLGDLYKLLDGADEKRLDDSQDAWLADAKKACPDRTSDGSITITDSSCLAARYAQRSALFDEIIAGCKAGACPLDKL
jgi:uncharacterized protein YecT (DUF1311 family)